MFPALRLGALLLALVPGLVVAAPARAADPEPGPAVATATATVTVTETTYTTHGDLVDTVVHDPVEVADGPGSVRATTDARSSGVAADDPAAVGQATTVSGYASSGGSSRASGCTLLSVMKEGHTALGFVSYQFVNQTHWCWTRSSQTVYDVWTDWFLGSFDPNFVWRGIVHYVHGFYDYASNDGHPRSAFKNLRIGRVDNCVLKYGCIGAYYPSVLIRSYYNGTYVWEIGG
jgi:hypothetical protein